MKRQVILPIAFLVLAACSALSAPLPEQTPTARTGLEWYFARSQSEAGTLAWLIGIDLPNHTGSLLTSTGAMLRLPEVAGDASGKVRFRSETVFGGAYEFEGSVKSGVLTGQIGARWSGAGASNLRSSALEGLVLTAPPANNSSGLVPIRLSNARASAETGDPVGADVEFFWTAKGPVGLMILFQGNWGEPAGNCLALSDISRTENVIRFRSQLKEGSVSYEIRLSSPNRGVLHRMSESRTSSDEVLSIKPSLLNVGPNGVREASQTR